MLAFFNQINRYQWIFYAIIMMLYKYNNSTVDGVLGEKLCPLIGI